MFPHISHQLIIRFVATKLHDILHTELHNKLLRRFFVFTTTIHIKYKTVTMLFQSCSHKNG